MATSSTSTTSSSLHTVGSQQYPYPSHVNATSFVSIKLSDESNYLAWKAQMMCLVHGHDMLGFIHGTVKEPQPQECDDSKDMADDAAFEAMHRQWERSDTLVKGWIFGSLSEEVMITVADLRTAQEVWNELLAKYTATTNTNTICGTEETEMEIEFSDTDETRMEIEFDKYNDLCRALQTGDWKTAQPILKRDKHALTAELNSEGHRSLHVAIGNPNDTEVLIHLLQSIEDLDRLPNLVDNLQRNALHYAAALGNTKAARLLVMINPQLLGTFDKDGYLPIHTAICNSHETTFKYLLEEHLTESITEIIDNPFKGENGAWLLCEIIMAGFLDVAYGLLMRYPELGNTAFDDNRMPPLRCIASKRDAFLSAKHYNFFQRFFSSRLDKYDPLCRALQNKEWVKARKFLNLDKTPLFTQVTNGNATNDIENQVTNTADPHTKCTESYVNHDFLPICLLSFLIERIIFLVVKVLLHLPRLKHLKKDKVDHIFSLKILEKICEKVGELPFDQHKHYEQAYFTAVNNNTLEVVEHITRTFPQSILMATSDGYMLPQLSIINRCEKIYNFFVHEVTHNKYLHIVKVDKKNNNLLHLAGKSAPTHKLNMVTGATLQMQRELQWFEEVKKLMRPKEREAMNIYDETPIMVFRDQHEDLRKEGEVWIKKVADSYIITAILIITIVFAAGITIPGGTKGNTGKPTFKNRPSFIVFLVSDAISLFTSTVSLLFFLSILTARYAEEDFLYMLPNRLMRGLVMLFISVTMMLIAFGATLHIMFGQENLSIMITIATITCLPIALFVALQLPLLLVLISSTYGHGIFQKGSELRITS